MMGTYPSLNGVLPGSNHGSNGFLSRQGRQYDINVDIILLDSLIIDQTDFWDSNFSSNQ